MKNSNTITFPRQATRGYGVSNSKVGVSSGVTFIWKMRIKLNRIFVRIFCNNRFVSQFLWNVVDQYIADRLFTTDTAIVNAHSYSLNKGLPDISITQSQGKLLEFIVSLTKAKRVLEIGTLGGFSTIYLARGLQKGGKVETIELNPHFANIANENISQARLAKKITVHVGMAVKILAGMVKTGHTPFDVVFIDADKSNYKTYLTYIIKLSHPGTVIIADNVVREGEIADSMNQDNNTVGIRDFLGLIGNNSRLDATAMQTVGSKGYDGLLFAVVK